MNSLAWIVIICILLAASFYDVRSRKIPNNLIVIGLASGIVLILTQQDYNRLIESAIIIVILLFISRLSILGNGDIKLLMVMQLFLGFFGMLFGLGLAEGLLILYGLAADKNESVAVLKNFGRKLKLRVRGTPMEQKSYPFAPFLFSGTLLLAFIISIIHSGL